MDDYLIVEGTHRQLYGRIGAHLITHEGVNGVLFSVWAPQASRVSVVGDFNQWDGRLHQMRKRVDSGLWELFAPGVGEGTNYKYEIVGPNGQLQPLKADPMGFGGEMRPSTASVVTRTDNFTWHDEAHMAARQGAGARSGPMSIYEVHLGSWRRNGWVGLPFLRRACEPVDSLCGGYGLHPYRAAARLRASARRFLGLSAHRPVRADAAVRRSGRLPALRRWRAYGGPWRDPRLGARALSRPTSTALPISTAPPFTSIPIRAAASTRTGTPASTISAGARSRIS